MAIFQRMVADKNSTKLYRGSVCEMTFSVEESVQGIL